MGLTEACEHVLTHVRLYIDADGDGLGHRKDAPVHADAKERNNETVSLQPGKGNLTLGQNVIMLKIIIHNRFNYRNGYSITHLFINSIVII
jgi:hypothetical protein